MSVTMLPAKSRAQRAMERWGDYVEPEQPGLGAACAEGSAPHSRRTRSRADAPTNRANSVPSRVGRTRCSHARRVDRETAAVGATTKSAVVQLPQSLADGESPPVDRRRYS